MVGHHRETGQNVLEVGVGIEAAPAAALDDGVEDGSSLPGSGFSHEQPDGMTFGKPADALRVRPV
jgi:hypothetical protein